MDFAVVKAEGHVGKPNTGFSWILSGTSFREADHGVLVSSMRGLQPDQLGGHPLEAWADFQGKTQSHKDTIPQLTDTFSACTGSSSPGKRAGSGWSGDSPSFLPAPSDPGALCIRELSANPSSVEELF